MSSGQWTVAVYLAGGQSLTEPMVRALQDMRDVTATSPGSLRALAQFEPDKKIPRMFAFDDEVATVVLRSLESPPKRVISPSALSSHELVLDDAESRQQARSTVSRLRRFIESARSVADGGPFLLAVSGHANGAVGDFLGCRDTDYTLSLSDLPDAFGNSVVTERKIDVVGMDCCNMSMAEVAFELAPYARYLVASEGEIPSHGWPYRQILAGLAGREPEEAVREIASQCARFFADYGLLDVPSHYAVCDLDRIGALSRALRGLSEALLRTIRDPAVWRPVVLAHWEAQSYKNEEYVDLADFCDRLAALVEDTEIRRRCRDVIAAVNDAVSLSLTSGAAFQYSTGLSVYFPWCNDVVKAKGESRTVSVLEKYKELSFSRETLWGDFIDACLLATRREPRRVESAGPGNESLEPVLAAV